MTREALLVRTMVELADTLVDDYDVVELLTRLADRCVEVLDVSTAGLMLARPGNRDLQLVASSSDAMRVLELFELQAAEGPCPGCYRSGEPVLNEDLTTVDGQWLGFAPRALEAGFRSVHAIPMRLRRQTIGALNLFRAAEGRLDQADLLAAQALAAIATIAILQQRAVAEARVLNEQLSEALNTQIVIEQAKGVLAERANLDMEQSFIRLRAHVRNHNLRLSDVAQGVIDGTLATESLDAAAPPR